MPRYRVEFEIEPTFGLSGAVRASVAGLSLPLPAGAIEGTVKVEQVDADPPIRQRFIVEVESPAGISAGRVRAAQIEYFLTNPLTLDDRRRVSAAEITDA